MYMYPKDKNILQLCINCIIHLLLKFRWRKVIGENSLRIKNIRNLGSQ